VFDSDYITYLPERYITITNIVSQVHAKVAFYLSVTS